MWKKKASCDRRGGGGRGGIREGCIGNYIYAYTTFAFSFQTFASIQIQYRFRNQDKPSFDRTEKLFT